MSMQPNDWLMDSGAMAAPRIAPDMVRGKLTVNGQRLTAGDAALLENEAALRLDAGEQAEVLVFDLEA